MLLFQKALNALSELRIHLVGYQHDAGEQQVEIDRAQISLDGFEEADLQQASLLHYHRGGITLFQTKLALGHCRGRVTGHPIHHWVVTQSSNNFGGQLGKVPYAFGVGKRDAAQDCVFLDSFQPALDCDVRIPLENGGNASLGRPGWTFDFPQFVFD